MIKSIRTKDIMQLAKPEAMMPYMPVFEGESEQLSPNNAVLWERNLESTET